MPYDDDDSKFKHLRDLEEILEAFLSLPENLTFGRLRAVLQALAALAAERRVEELTFVDVARALQEHRLSRLPVNVTLGLLEAVAPLAKEGDVLGRLSIKDLEEVLARAQGHGEST